MIFKLFRQWQKRRLFSKLLTAIEQADDTQISQIIHAVIRRYSLVFPDWDVLFLSLPKDPSQRRLQLEHMLEQLKEGHTF